MGQLFIQPWIKPLVLLSILGHSRLILSLRSTLSNCLFIMDVNVTMHVPEIALPESLFPTTNEVGQADFRYPTSGIFLSSLPRRTQEDIGNALGIFMAEHETFFEEMSVLICV